MNIYELMYNPFFIDGYEHFLVEVFNINPNNTEDLIYLVNKSYKSNISNLFYYGTFVDNDFNDIEIYVVKLIKMDDYKNLDEIIYNLLSLNQTNHAFITVYSDYTDRWFFSYLFSEFIVEDNKLVTYKSKLDDFIHWYGYGSCDNVYLQLLNINVSHENIRFLLENNPNSQFIMKLADIKSDLDMKSENNLTRLGSYKLLLKVLLSVIISRRPKSSLMNEVYDRVVDIAKSYEKEVTIETIFDLYCYLNNQETLSQKHINSVCEDTLIEYLTRNTPIFREDIIDYIKHAYDNRNLIVKNIDEAIKNGGRRYTNMKIPLSVIYNIDTIDNLLNNMKILDFSINSCITTTTLTHIINRLKYVNKLIQGYANASMDNIHNETLKNNIYMITLNKDSITTARRLLMINDDTQLNLKYADALNLYPEYEHIRNEIGNMDTTGKSKTEVIDEIVNKYNRTHFHTKMNINFEEKFIQKHGYEALIYELDYPGVFTDNHKFDIIISNMEHVKLTGQKELKKELRRYKLYDNNTKYEYYYIEKALELIDKNGIITLIMDDEYKSMEDKRIREYLKEYEILQIKNNELIYTKNRPGKNHRINGTTPQETLNNTSWENIGE